MAKKKLQNSDPSNSLDLSKGFSNGAFSSLKSLQDISKSKAEEQKEIAAQKEAQIRARIEKQKADVRDFRFTEEDLNDHSDMSDAEIFEASMKALDKGIDVYQSKFNVKEAPKKQTKSDEPEHLTMSDEEREFALFTQEMAISNVTRMKAPPKPVHKVRNKGKYLQKAEDLENFSPVGISETPAQTDAGMRTDYVSPAVSVTQVEKGDDIIERPDMDDAMTAAQKQLLHDVKRYEARYGIVITLKLRGLTLNAAMARLDEFITACVRENRPYALIICGKGLGSEGEPVIKNGTIEHLRSDKRIIEYAPVLNADRDFGSLYVSFRKN